LLSVLAQDHIGSCLRIPMSVKVQEAKSPLNQSFGDD